MFLLLICPSGVVSFLPLPVEMEQQIYGEIATSTESFPPFASLDIGHHIGWWLGVIVDVVAAQHGIGGVVGSCQHRL